MKTCITTLFLFVFTLPMFAQYREVNLPEKPKQSKYENIIDKEKGFWCAFDTEAGSSIMEMKTNMQFISISFTSGYRFNEYLRVGAGFGGKMYINNAYVRNTKSKFGIPVYANLRGNFISAYDRDGVPFWSVNFGGITKEGLFLNPTIGYSFGGLRNNFFIGLSYTLTDFKDFTNSKQNYSYFGLKLGYEL